VWQSPDPAMDGLQYGFNIYSYARNNPIRYKDPNGLWVDNGDGSFIAEKNDTLSGLQSDTGRDWKTSNFNRDPKTLQIGESVSFAEGEVNPDAPVVDNTAQATAHYYNGNGAAANIGNNTRNELRNSERMQTAIRNLRAGNTQMTQNFGVDLFWDTFHIGGTPVDYNTTCGGRFCVTNFRAFVRDGFWDAQDPFNWFEGDGMGPDFEDDNGSPYPYVPFNFSISYPAPRRWIEQR